MIPSPIFIGPKSLCEAALRYTRENYDAEGMAVCDDAARFLHVYVRETFATIEGELGPGLDSVYLEVMA